MYINKINNNKIIFLYTFADEMPWFQKPNAVWADYQPEEATHVLLHTSSLKTRNSQSWNLTANWAWGMWLWFCLL